MLVSSPLMARYRIRPAKLMPGQDWPKPHFFFPVQVDMAAFMQEMKLQELKNKTPTDLLTFAESVEVENASVMRKQELMFAILKRLAAKDIEIIGEGVVEILQDGFGSCARQMPIICRGRMISISRLRRYGVFH